MQFLADGKAVPLSQVRVHLKRQPRGRTASFAWHIPAASATEVFGPHELGDLVQGSSVFRRWEREVDNVTVQGWLVSAMSLEQISQERPRWVICAIKRVKQIDSDYLIEGVVEEFAPELYR